jgi:endonuclease YncB( thermonuclease family)
MVRQGWAVAYTRYSLRYVPDELIARFADRGIWFGDFTTPEDWRRQHR